MKLSTIAAILLLTAHPGIPAVRAQTATDIRPTPVSLFEAIKLTEHYNTEHKLQPLPQFLSSVRYIVPKASVAERPFGDQPYWEVTYDLVHDAPTRGQHFYVGIDKTVRFMPGE